jgi:hypothetical protein
MPWQSSVPFLEKGKRDSLSQEDCEAKENYLVGLTKIVLNAVKDTNTC